MEGGMEDGLVGGREVGIDDAMGGGKEGRELDSMPAAIACTVKRFALVGSEGGIEGSAEDDEANMLGVVERCVYDVAARGMDGGEECDMAGGTVGQVGGITQDLVGGWEAGIEGSGMESC